MIPADCFLDKGDGRAWWAVPDEDHVPQHWERPCDACNGDAIIGIKDYPSTQPIDCPDCDGTGRHTFTVKVACDHFDDPESPTINCWNCEAGRRTLRVHVIDVLPIYDAEDDEYPNASHYSTGESECWLWEWDEAVSDFICHENIPVPSAAEPGMWIVKLAVHVKEE